MSELEKGPEFTLEQKTNEFLVAHANGIRRIGQGVILYGGIRLGQHLPGLVGGNVDVDSLLRVAIVAGIGFGIAKIGRDAQKLRSEKGDE